MVARVARFEGLDVEAVERGMEEAERVIRSLVVDLPGYRGDLHVWSPGGEMTSITVFASEEDARAAEPTFDEVMPERLGALFANWRGRRTSVGLHRVAGDLL